MADRTVRVRLQAEINQYIAAMKQAGNATAEFGRNISGTGDKAKKDIDQIGNSALVAGGVLAGAFAAAIGSTMKFDSQLSELAAVSSATTEEMESLRQAALDAGAATAFSASQAAQAQTELAKAGVSTSDILGGALAGSLDLAAAGGLDLARAAEIAANAMTTFDLAGSQVNRVADVLAAGANKSATDVDELAQALQQSGLVADQFGLSLEDSVGTLAAFGQAGLRGSDAGTSFKTMLQRLVPQSAEARDLMRELGIEMFDAAGNFVGIEGAAQELQDSLTNLTVEQRNSALATIFGSDAVRGATILYEQGADGIGEWVRQVDDSGFAAEVAGTRLDNLAGDFEALRGSIETALIDSGSKATDALRFLTQSATNVVTGFTELPDIFQWAGVALTGLAGAGSLTLGAVAKLGPKVAELKDSLTSMGSAGAAVANNLGKIAGTAAAAGAAVAIWSAWEGVLAQARQSAADWAQGVRDDVDLLNTPLGELEGKIERLRWGQEELNEAADDSRAPWDADKREELRAGADELSEFGDEIQRIIDVADALAQQYNLTREAALAFVQDQMASGVDVLAGDFNRVVEELGNVVASEAATSTAIENIGGQAEASFGDAEEAAKRAADAVDDYMAALRAATDPLFALTRAERNHAANQRAVSTSQQDLAEAVAQLDEVRSDPEATARDIERAEQAIVDAYVGVEDAHLAVYDSAFAVEEAQAALAESMATGVTDIDSAAAALQRLADQGLITQGQVDALLGPFGTLLGQVQTLSTYSDITMIVNAETAEAEAGLGRVIAMIQTVYGTVPAYVEPGFIGPLVPGQTRLIETAYGQVPAQLPSGFVGPLVPGQNRGNAGGGWAGSNTWGPTDTIPTSLSPGEFVLSTQGASAFSPAELYGMNRGIRPASGGGGWEQVVAAIQGWSGGGFNVTGNTIVAADPAQGMRALMREVRREEQLQSAGGWGG